MEKAERVVKYNEKDNVPIQTEKGEAETHENAEVEHLADENEIELNKGDWNAVINWASQHSQTFCKD